MVRSFLLILVVCWVWTAQAETPNYGYDLRSNITLSHHSLNGPVADVTEPGFVKYLRDIQGRWRLGVQHLGAPAAFAPGIQANLWFAPLPDRPRTDRVLEVRLAPLGKGQRMDVFVDGKKVGHTVFSESGWQTHRIALDDTLKAHRVRFHFRRSVTHEGMRTAAAIRYVRITAKTVPALPEKEPALKAALSTVSGQKIRLTAGGALTWHIVPPKGAQLNISASAPVTVLVDGGRGPKVAGEGTSLNIPFKSSAGRAIALTVKSQSAVTFSGGISGGSAGQPTARKAPKYVIFWLIDTLRADKLKFYEQPNANGRKKPDTPNLSQLATEATVFETFWVQGNESKASHASLFTGTYPAVHKVYGHKAKLASRHTTLAEAFKSAGYVTGGYVSNGYISDRWNFAQGFTKRWFKNFIRENMANNAKAVTNFALRFIKANKKKPFYLYLGTSDPHVTYRRHKSLIKKYDPKPYSGRYRKSLTGTELGKIKGSKKLPTQRDQVRIEALYENEIEFNDIHFGRLVKTLKDEGMYDDTMIIISSDHGDEFWEHGSCGHGQSLYQELINVPLVIKANGWFPQGGQARFGTDSVDLLPTIQRILGQDVAKDVQGFDLLGRVWSKGPIYPVANVASMGTKRYALKVGPAKIVMAGPGALSAYDTTNDPAEKTDVSKSNPIILHTALDPLLVFTAHAKNWKRAVWGPPNNLSPQFDVDVRKKK